MSTYTIEGAHAIRLAKRDGIASVTVAQVGWDGEADGYNISDYFRAGRYLGPDCDGVEPTWQDA